MNEKKWILVIDDDESVRLALCENLEDCGFNVTCAANGDHGLKLIADDGLPDLVITDIIMPQKEGLETIQEIRKKYPGVKLIAMSGGGRTKIGDFLEMARKFGSDAILPKPIDMDELETTVRKLVG